MHLRVHHFYAALTAFHLVGLDDIIFRAHSIAKIAFPSESGFFYRPGNGIARALMFN